MNHKNIQPLNAVDDTPREELEAALKQEPDNTGILYKLALIYILTASRTPKRLSCSIVASSSNVATPEPSMRVR